MGIKEDNNARYRISPVNVFFLYIFCQRDRARDNVKRKNCHQHNKKILMEFFTTLIFAREKTLNLILIIDISGVFRLKEIIYTYTHKTLFILQQNLLTRTLAWT